MEIGQKFNRWTILEKAPSIKHGKTLRRAWYCKCECGTVRAVSSGDLTSGRSASCGCFQREGVKQRSTKHGMYKHPAYQAWNNAVQRCFNSENPGYPEYGGRGITMSDEWRNDFGSFWKDMGPSWTRRSTLDRKEVNGNYERGNCRWATPKEQANNRRTNIMVTGPGGVKMTVTQAAEAYGVNRLTVYSRIKNNWPESEWFRKVSKE